ncbi:MAG: OsmC family protein [Candidatus Limnocylindrales bacterium]|nr:OsmC family protein [Candidatus Limnocylindrales bacterium]
MTVDRAAAAEGDDVRLRSVRADWRGGYRVELEIRDGRFSLVCDETPEDGGADAGPMPSEMLFASVASCFAMAIAWAAQKRRQEMPDLEVVVSGRYDRPQRRYDRLEIVASSSLAADEPDRFDALILLAREVCWVTRTIEPGIAISIRAGGPGEASPR